MLKKGNTWFLIGLILFFILLILLVYLFIVSEEPLTGNVVERSPSNIPLGEGTCKCITDLDCKAFNNQKDAQICYEYCLDLRGFDFHGLDNNNDGIACNS